MSVTVYKALRYRTLAGKKLYQNNAWHTIPENAKMYLNGIWYKIGSAGIITIPSVSIPGAPTIQTITHANGTEPSSGTKWYITPAGCGNMSGTSWANAASGSMIHLILLSCSSGDSVYLAEGDYTADRTIGLPAGVSLYGGFDASNPSWGTRNGFTKPTVFSREGSSSFDFLSAGSATTGQVVDGISTSGYTAKVISGDLIIRNGVFDRADQLNKGTMWNINRAEHCILNGCMLYASTVSYVNIIDASCTISGATADHINVYGSAEAVLTASIPNGAISNSNFVYTNLSANTASYCNVHYGNCTISGNTTASHVSVYGKDNNNPVEVSFNPNAEYCSVYFGLGRYIFEASATNCIVVNCSNKKYGRNPLGLFQGTATNCTAVDCTIYDDSAASCIFEGDTINCTAVNCCRYNGGRFFRGSAMGCTAVNCTHGDGFDVTYGFFAGDAIKCTAINCKGRNSGRNYDYFFNASAVNCIAVNCSYTGVFCEMATNCTFVNCAFSVFPSSKNSLAWNCGDNIYPNSYDPITCAGSYYNAKLALVLGTDNTIARFTNTGYAPARGVQDVGDCPSPISDPTGYAAWIAAFGDWHPLANSFLVGRGTADSNVTTDADGVARPDPPTIGAYEPVQANA